MRAIIEILLAILFTVMSGTVFNQSSNLIKRSALLKVQKGLPSLEDFTKRMTN